MMPIMTEAFGGLQSQSQFALLSAQQENFDTVESSSFVAYFLGTLQPLKPRQVLIKKEGLRKWKWFQLWTKQDIKPHDYIRDNKGIQYRVMSKHDWSQAGFYEYEIIEAASMNQEAA